jgi:hypothetical protein
MIGKWWIGKDVKGSSRYPILRYCLGTCLERLRKTTKNLRIVVSGPRFETGTSRIRSRSVNRWTTTFTPAFHKTWRFILRSQVQATEFYPGPIESNQHVYHCFNIKTKGVEGQHLRIIMWKNHRNIGQSHPSEREWRCLIRANSSEGREIT